VRKGDLESADITINILPVKFDSCTIVFEEIKHTALPKNNYYESELAERTTVPLGSVDGGTVKKVNKDFFEASENLEKFVVLLRTTSNVILVETHLTSSIMWAPFSDLPKTRIKGKDEVFSNSTNNAHLIFSDKSTATRVLAAFRHAADLCRGKEPF
jgi:hypothetical protein